jgi:Uma2 family endonuclease
MATINTHPIMVEQYEHSFAGVPGFRDELINGRIVMTPDAKPLHQQVQQNIRRLLDAACKDSGYICNGDSNIKLTPYDMPSPDLFIVSWPAWRRAMQDDAYVNVPPLLAVEILSPNQDASEKVDIYLNARVDVVWVVDPKQRTVIAYWRTLSALLDSTDDVTLPAPLKGALRVEDFFVGLPE